ncbi:Senescence regulator S40 protein [Dioscorea alata]|uniref:Senescence regulator S40 protein n=1 Tax=Dioscorea alata TaxID=55571 RepID=A0ACB7UNV1_DIOAL|nr:Senescence regulator S40 protein [Dioscorea alata]
MAKGRKHGSERLLGTWVGGGGTAAAGGNDLPDLREEDVWSAAVGEESEECWYREERERQQRRWMTDREDRQVGGLSLAFEDGCRTPSTSVIHQFREVGRSGTTQQQQHHRRHAAASAPVNVPDWSRVRRVDYNVHGEVVVVEEEEEEERDEEWVAPHEYLAREHGRSVATSVFEGVGRTLKGRDMSRVRDAVWSQTGFFG